MTSAELRRLADQKMVESNALRRDADRLRLQAAVLRGLLDPLAAISQRVWAGPAATDFEEKSAAHARQVDEQAERLRRIAGEFDDRSRRLRRDAEALRSQARVVDAAAAAAAAGLPTAVV